MGRAHSDIWGHVNCSLVKARKPTNITQKAQKCLKNFLLGLCEIWMMSQNEFVFFLMWICIFCLLDVEQEVQLFKSLINRAVPELASRGAVVFMFMFLMLSNEYWKVSGFCYVCKYHWAVLGSSLINWRKNNKFWFSTLSGNVVFSINWETL